jgi:mannose-6-phosphate isomerase-like protein (cupin superfamily)
MPDRTRTESKLMTDAQPGNLVMVPPGGGLQVRRLNGEDTRVTAGAAQTRGAYAVRENAAPPRFGAVPLHIHRFAEEAFYVLDGTLTFYAPDRRFEAPTGSFVLIPRDTVHAIANSQTNPVRWLTLISPADESDWILAEHDLILASDGHPGADALAAIHRRFGLEIVGPPPPLP